MAECMHIVLCVFYMIAVYDELIAVYVRIDVVFILPRCSLGSF